MGIDSAGRPLGASMPRYALSREDLDDLVAYLKELGRDADPGITDRAIVLGSILAPPASLAEMNGAVRSVLTAYFQDVNRRGGIYNRHVELRWLDMPESAEDRAAAVRRFLSGVDTFALLAPFIAGSESAVGDAVREQKIPVLGPFSLYPESVPSPNRYVFFLHAGLADQLRALAVFAGDRFAGRKPSAAVVLDGDDVLLPVAEEVRSECQRMGWGPVELLTASSGAEAGVQADRMLREKVGVVFLLASEWRGVDVLLAAASRDGSPLILMPGALTGKGVLRAMAGIPDHLFLSYPTLPVDGTRAGAAEYERLAAAHGLPREHRSSQVAALAAAKLFVEAMTAAGRAAGREDLIEHLEHFYEQPTGFTRPITFGPNRRSGTRGAYILGVDPKQAKLVPVSGFIEPDIHSP
jgi:ABC-type branched-subunit amino acid transport system substrate-binding protein